MPYSYNYFKDDFRDHLIKNFSSDIKILDVGPGSGSYYDLLCKDFTNIDAVEVYEPYIDQFNLRDKYKNVYNQDILEFNYNSYNYLILGDVLEHLSINDAQNLLADLTFKNIYSKSNIGNKSTFKELNVQAFTISFKALIIC